MKIKPTRLLIYLAICMLALSFYLHQIPRRPVEEFGCSRDDVIKAAVRQIKFQSGSHIQSDVIYRAKWLYDKPASVYMEALYPTSVSLINVSTTSIDNNGSMHYCSAKVRVQVPSRAMEVAKEVPALAERLKSGYGEFHNGSVYWSGFRYTVELDDRQSPLVGRVDADVSWALYNMVAIAVNGDEQILKYALERNRDEDALLNNAWASLPPSLRATKLQSQRDWIKEREEKCGDGMAETFEAADLSRSADSVKCLTSMTTSRRLLLSRTLARHIFEHPIEYH